MAQDSGPGLIVRLSVGLRCPRCKTAPKADVAQAAFGKASSDQLLGCRTCGVVRPKTDWIQLVPDPDFIIEGVV